MSFLLLENSPPRSELIVLFGEELQPFVGELTWENLNPQALLQAVENVEEFDLGNVGQLLLRVMLLVLAVASDQVFCRQD